MSVTPFDPEKLLAPVISHEALLAEEVATDDTSQHASISEHAQLENAPSSDLNLPLVSLTFSHEGDFNRSSSFSQVDSRTSGTMASSKKALSVPEVAVSVSEAAVSVSETTFSHEGDFNRSSSFSQVDSRTSGTMASFTTTLGMTSPDYASLDEAQLEVPSKLSIVEQLSKTIEAERSGFLSESLAACSVNNKFLLLVVFFNSWKKDLTVDGDIHPNPGPEHLYSALGSEWLNDATIVNFFSTLESLNIGFIDPAVIVTLLDDWNLPSNHLKTFMNNTCCIPVNDITRGGGGSHWSLLIFRHYNHDNFVSDLTFKVGERIVQRLGQIAPITCLFDNPRQSNNSDCGVFVCCYALQATKCYELSPNFDLNIYLQLLSEVPLNVSEFRVLLEQNDIDKSTSLPDKEARLKNLEDYKSRTRRSTSNVPIKIARVEKVLVEPSPHFALPTVQRSEQMKTSKRMYKRQTHNSLKKVAPSDLNPPLLLRVEIKHLVQRLQDDVQCLEIPENLPTILSLDIETFDPTEVLQGKPRSLQAKNSAREAIRQQNRTKTVEQREADSEALVQNSRIIAMSCHFCFLDENNAYHRRSFQFYTNECARYNHDPNLEFNVQSVYCQSEHALLISFMALLDQYKPSFICGHTVLPFDWPVIKNRCAHYGVHVFQRPNLLGDYQRYLTTRWMRVVEVDFNYKESDKCLWLFLANLTHILLDVTRPKIDSNYPFLLPNDVPRLAARVNRMLIVYYFDSLYSLKLFLLFRRRKIIYATYQIVKTTLHSVFKHNEIINSIDDLGVDTYSLRKHTSFCIKLFFEALYQQEDLIWPKVDEQFITSLMGRLKYLSGIIFNRNFPNVRSAVDARLDSFVRGDPPYVEDSDWEGYNHILNKIVDAIPQFPEGFSRIPKYILIL
ncbi:hypothetical protein RCL1_000980 [Eukaryota sp. TZLM3-RCL]